MSISRLLLTSIFVVGALPSLAQSLPSGRSPDSLPPLMTSPSDQAFPCVVVVSPGSKTISPTLKKELCSKAEKGLSVAMGRYILQKDSRCYSIRDYRFTQDNPESNVPKLTDYSTCESASLFQKRDVVTPSK